jgi:transcriptional regulator with XRE-family HTH domain/Zn-dependent peptidase ImmA (M78 family)
MNFVDTIEVGTRIRAIREQKKLTLKELAIRTGLDVGQLSRIESNKVGARESTFRRIAAGLGVPPETFILKKKPLIKHPCSSGIGKILKDETEESDIIFDEEAMKAQALFVAEAPPFEWGDTAVEDDFPICCRHLRPQNSHDTVIARENCRAVLEAARTIERLSGVTPRALLQLALPILPTAHGAGLLARQVRTMLGIGDAFCYDYFELFARHGIRTLELQLPEAVGSLSSYDASQNQATIFISSGLPATRNTAERKIYCLVTELANILLENARQASILEDAPALEKLSDEKFTRHFAALFLLPAEAVREVMRQYRLTPERWTYELMLSLKNRFGVSAQAFCYRLLELGCITESLAADFRSQIETHYAQVRTTALKNSRTNELLPFEPSPTDRVARLNAFLCDLLKLISPKKLKETECQSALSMLKKLGCVEKGKG